MVEPILIGAGALAAYAVRSSRTTTTPEESDTREVNMVTTLPRPPHLTERAEANIDDSLGSPGLHQYRVIDLDLSVARTGPERLAAAGASLMVSELAGSLSLSFNNAESKQIAVREGEVYSLRFNQLFLSNLAQPNGGTAKLLISTGEAAFDIAAAPGRRPITVYPATATSGALALSTTEARRFRLVKVTLKFNSKPSTSEDVTLTLNAADGAAYDAVIGRANPSTGSGTGDIIMTGDDNDIFESGDELDLAFTNTDGRTFGARITTEPV